MTSGRGKDRSDLERTNCINATRTDCGTKLWAATRHAPGLGTARVTRFMAGADEPYEGILHVRVCGGRRGQPRLLPGSECGRAKSVVNSDALGRPRRSPAFDRVRESQWQSSASCLCCVRIPSVRLEELSRASPGSQIQARL